ncbi:hypothetical protein [Mucilaginibacter sp.]|nr:hypothetical protein [Mucilaginibacter sp.]
MKKNKLFLIGLIGLLSFSACSIFKKDCGCPHFGKVKTTTKQAPVVYAAR